MAADERALFKGIGKRLGEVRNELGLSQSAMAAALDVSPRSYHSYEKGVRGIPVEVIARLSADFNVDSIWLIYGRPNLSVEFNLDELERIYIRLHTALEGKRDCVSLQKKAVLLSKLYKSMLDGRGVNDDELEIWIELVKY